MIAGRVRGEPVDDTDRAGAGVVVGGEQTVEHRRDELVIDREVHGPILPSRLRACVTSK